MGGGGYSGVNIAYLKCEVFHWGGLFWSEIPERGFLENFDKFHAVFGEIWQNGMLVPALGSWWPLFGEILDPPLVTSDFCLNIKYIFL